MPRRIKTTGIDVGQSIDDPPELREALATFRTDGITSFWTEATGALAQSMMDRIAREEADDEEIWQPNSRYRSEIYTTFPEVGELFRGDLGAFMKAYYGCDFKVYYGILYKSERLTDTPTGSQLWHADGGPGTCTNVMFLLKDLTLEDGAMEALNWSDSLKIYARERDERIRLGSEIDELDNARDRRAKFYEQQVQEHFHAKVIQPTGRAGMVIPFRNNLLHRGGYPEPGHTRYACVFHIYPSDRAPNWDQYAERGIPKRGPLPRDPAEDF